MLLTIEKLNLNNDKKEKKYEHIPVMVNEIKKIFNDGEKENK